MKIPNGLARIEGSLFLRSKHEDLRDELAGGPIGITRRSGDVEIVIMDIGSWIALTQNTEKSIM